MKGQKESLFLMICISFSTLLLVLSLLSSIRLTAVNDRTAGLERELEAARTENAILRAEYENSISLDALARRAEALGMQRCTPSQVVWVEQPVS